MLNNFVYEKEKIGRTLLKNLFSNTEKYSIYFADYENEEVDFIMYGKEKVYVGDIKCYRDNSHKRPHNKFKDYQVDYKKLQAITDKASRINATPILAVFFTDQLMIWDLNTVDWQSTKKDVATNAKGYDYGNKKTIEPQAFLNLEQAYYVNNKININN